VSWRTRAPPSAGKVLTRFRKPREAFKHLLLVPAHLFWIWQPAQANLAVIGCQPPPQRTVADVRESERTPVDAPPTVLKTAELTFANAHYSPPKFSLLLSTFRSGTPSSAVVRGLGCLLGCLTPGDLSQTVGELWASAEALSPASIARTLPRPLPDATR
jgi:hypothetical protein